ncbi:MAG: hypothetical protein MK209_10050, partial [Planctomycetes bacterium]|nr:hypothetical protein [Planctomycetota bacterium]
PVYVADATESVRVIEDSGGHISLQHILVLDGGFGRPPKIVKHWRQDWRWQDAEILEYRGREHFVRVELTPQEVQGTWSQAVYQTSDQPRYESYGKWRHIGETSSWISEETWRPLPRRDATKRDDYQVVMCRNIHTITASGWLHEQENSKLVLDENGDPDRILVLEHGTNSYEHATSEEALVDFTEADRYWAATADYWSDVRAAWNMALGAAESMHIATHVEGIWIARSILEHAEEIYRPGESQGDVTQARPAPASASQAPIDRARSEIESAVKLDA